MNFEAHLKNPKSALAMDFDPGHDTLLLAFGGMHGLLGIPPFEFFNLTRGLPDINKIFLRDVLQMWYHRGLPGVARNIDELAAFLRAYTGHPATRRIVVFGNSGGGYAALLFGQLLQADVVHAFAAKTFISPLRRLAARDLQSWKRTIALTVCRKAQRSYFDLRRLFRRSPNATTEFHMHFAARHRVDRLHAAHLKAMPRMHLHAYPYGDHTLIRRLRENGELRRIIEHTLQGAAVPTL